MLATPTPFPFAGSKAFLKDSAEPVTILRKNADGTALIRRDPRPGEGPHRDASGNREEPLANLFETEDAAARAGLPQSKRPNQRRSATSGPQARTRAAAPAAKPSRADARRPAPEGRNK